MLNFTDPKGTCQNLNLCEASNVMELIQEERPLELQAHIDTVNSNTNSTWVAGVNNKFEGMSLKEVSRLMGTIVDPDWAISSETGEFTLSDDLPTNFDSREQWTDCAATINHIRDQSNCGSCWAHGTTEAFNDRLCIKTKGEFKKLLSTSDTTGCCGFLEC